MTTTTGAIGLLLKKTGSTIECQVQGASMGAALPDGARLRVRFEERPRLAVGDVVAFSAGTGVVVHRIVGRGVFGPARSFVLTRGDGALLVDHPLPAGAVLGVVREWTKNGAWQPVPPCSATGWLRAAGWIVLVPVFAALHVQHRLAKALTIVGFTTRAIVHKLRAGVK